MNDMDLQRKSLFAVFQIAFHLHRILFHYQGWVSVGVDHDTAEFAIESIRHWWEEMGKPMYARATF